MTLNVMFAYKSGSVSVQKVEGKTAVTPHFTVEELANTKGDPNKVQLILNDETMLFYRMLEEFRIWFNKPMKCNSCFRQKDFNAKCGGSSNSLHLDGLAFDWGIKGHTDQQRENVKKKWQEICKRYGRIGGINFYTNGYHLSAYEDKFRNKYFVIRDYRGKKGDW